MDRYERFYRRSLRDVLVGQGVLTAEQADELAESAYEANEAFSYALVDAGYLSPWELATVVAGYYQMPVLPLVGYEYDTDMLEGVAAAELFQYQVLPVGRYGRTWTFAVAEPPTRECIAALKETFGPALFFFAADAELVKTLITEHVKVVDAAGDTTWKSLFDDADQLVQQQLVIEPEENAA